MLSPPHTEAEFQAHLRAAETAPVLPVDTEGTLTHPHSETWGLSWYAGGCAEYYPFNHMFGQNLPSFWLDQIKPVIENHPCLLFHNAKHDVRSLRNLGIKVKGHMYYDNMLTAHMVDENLYSRELDALAKKYVGRSKEKSEEMTGIIKAFGWEYIPAETMRHYGAVDAEITGLVFNQLYPEWEAEDLSTDYWDVEREFSELVGDMEDEGITIDTDLCESELARGRGEMTRLRLEIGFNPASPIELGKYLLEDLQLPVVKVTKGGKPSFDKEAMEDYELMLLSTGNKTAEMVLAFRGWQKTTGSNYESYLNMVGPDGRLRPNFKLHGTRTGRLSCEKPNLQQIPRASENDWNGKLKQTIIQDPGFKSWEFDFSQLEFRLATAYANQLNLIEIFNDPSRDVFSEMAADLGMDRQDVKTLVYTIQYGGGVNRIKNVFGISEMNAMQIKHRFLSTYRGLKQKSDYANGMAKGRGYLKYWTGRRRHFPDVRQAHKGWNSLIQGGAFEIVKRATLAVNRAGLIDSNCRLNLQVHDSLRFSIVEGMEHVYIPEIKRIMETPEKNFGVKFKVEVNEWATKNEYTPVAA